jgi:hypothetical protein
MLIEFMERTGNNGPVLDVFGGRYLSVEDTGVLTASGENEGEPEDVETIEREAATYTPIPITSANETTPRAA